MNEDQYIPAENQIKHDINEMDKKGAFDDPEQYQEIAQKEDLLEKYEVFEKNSKGEQTGTINHVRLAKLLLKDDGHHYAILQDNETMYYYNGSYWEPNGEQIFTQRVLYYLDDKTTINRTRETLAIAKKNNYVTREKFTPQEHLINFKNGIYNWQTREILDHSPEYYFLGEIPHNYDPEAKSPEILSFFEETLNAEDMPLLQEILGDCLQPTYKYKKALMLVGPTDTGKSQLLNLICKLLGDKNISHEQLYNLCHDRFKAIELYGKLANICNDIDATGIRATSMFLMLVGGDYISGQKKHQDPFKFRNYAKLIFSCNQIPESKNQTPAYYNRWLVFECNNQIPKDEQIPFYFDVISTPEEISGLINWAIQGLERLAAAGHYSEHRSIEDVSLLMREHGNPLAEFCKANITPDPQGEITKKDLYKAYVEFCNFFNFPTKTDNVFSRMIKKYLPMGYSDGWKGKVTVWRGFSCNWENNGNDKKGINEKLEISTDSQQETVL